MEGTNSGSSLTLEWINEPQRVHGAIAVFFRTEESVRAETSFLED